MCSGWVLGDPTTISRGNIRAAVGLADQGRGCFFLFIVVNNSKESVALRRSAS
jgi:hypothetical protein